MRKLIHYELLFFYLLGFSPRELTKMGYSRGSVYRFHRIYREAGKRARERLLCGNSVSPEGKHRANDQGQTRKRIGRPPREKSKCWVRNPDTQEMEEVWL